MAPRSGSLPLAVLQQHLVPLAVHVRAGLAEAGRQAHGLHRVLAPKLPLQVVAGDEVAQAGVEGADVVVLQVDLDEGLPVVVALVQLHVVEHVAVERQVTGNGHAGQVGSDVAAVVLEQQAVPLAQWVVAQAQAGVALEVGRAQQLAAAGIGPAVDRADDVAARMALALGLQVAAATQHDGLAVAAAVGDQLDLALCVAHQCAPARLLGQHEVVMGLGHGQRVAHVARPGLEEQLLFALEPRLVEVGMDGKLTCRLL
jgi:hypothetical protein